MQMLTARENRARRQQALLEEYRCPLICFTMNIPGPVKNSALIRRSFRWGLASLEEKLTGIRYRAISEEVTGCEAFLAVEEDPQMLKQICMLTEEETPLGRLFDMDVLTVTGEKLERPFPRSCIVCGTPGRGCASRRLHSLEELTRTVRQIMEVHFVDEDSRRIARLAVESLLQEVHTTPKPGLVDGRNSGSHTDMDVRTFTASAEALEPYFRTCFLFGRKTARKTPEETFSMLRRAGIGAEKEMYRVTGGVNTHKGAIFTLGLLCGSIGRVWNPEGVFDTEKILKECTLMGECCIREDFGHPVIPETAGEKLYAGQGITGIRGEAAAGLPSVRNIGLPVFRRCLTEGYSENDAGAITLLHLIAGVEDTNLYHRGGKAGAAWAKAAAETLLPRPAMARIAELDEAFMERNLSPGGCADLLAATLFLHKLDKTGAAG